MTQEDRELLIRDLCSRLPYGVKVKFTINKNIERNGNIIYVIDGEYSYVCNKKTIITYDNIKYVYNGFFDDVKPYLFPLSSLTSKQRTEIGKILTDIQKQYSPYGVVNTEGCDDLFICSVKQSNALINYCLSQHLDINGLIEKGFAEDATGLNIY